MLFNKKNDDHMHDFTTPPRAAVVPAASDHAQPPKPRKAQTRSVIDPGLLITGTVEGDGELQIDGQVLGDIRCTHLTIGNAASIEGNIAAEEIVVRGRVKGAIAGNRVVLADGAHVESNIFHKKLSIEEGAHFQGAVCPKDNPFDELRAMTVEARAAGAAKGEPGEMESGTPAATPHVQADDKVTVEANPPAEPVKPPSARASKGKAKSIEMESSASPAAAGVAADDKGAIDANLALTSAKSPSARTPTELERLQARLRS